MNRVFNASGGRLGRSLLFAATWGWGQGLGLEDLIRAGLENNGDLKVQIQEVNTASMDTQYAATAVNPHLELEARHNLSEPNRPSAGIRLSREFQPGIRTKSRQAAKAEWRAGKEWLNARKQGLIHDIRTSYFDWQILNRKAALQRGALSRWEGLSKSAAGQVAQGKLSEVDLGQAQLNAAKARQKELFVLSEIGSTENRIRLLTGQGNVPDTLAPERQDSLWRLPPLDSLWAWASRESPEIAAMEREADAGALRLALEQGRAAPAFSLSLGYDREPDGENMFGGGLEIPLAMFNRNQAGISKARSSLKESELRKSAAREQSRAEVAELHARLANLAERYEHFKGRIRDLGRKQMSLAEKGFRQGMLGMFDLSKVQEEVLDREMESLDILQEYYRTLNRLGRLVGGKVW
jgi:cobalt-zinc-cadmium efflux system outer membrane protein